MYYYVSIITPDVKMHQKLLVIIFPKPEFFLSLGAFKQNVQSNVICSHSPKTRNFPPLLIACPLWLWGLVVLALSGVACNLNYVNLITGYRKNVENSPGGEN
jgi:hypothetical protein